MRPPPNTLCPSATSVCRTFLAALFFRQEERRLHRQVLAGSGGVGAEGWGW